MKILPVRFALLIVAMYASGVADTISSATAAPNVFTAGQRSFPASATVTCNPLPPVHLRLDSRPFCLEPLPQVRGRQLQRFERNVRRGIEVKDQAVGIINRIDRSAPRMNFDRAHLDDFQQAFFVLYVQVFVALAFMPKFEWMHILSESPPWTALIETLPAIDSGRAAQQAERAPNDAGQHEGCDGGVIFREFTFGNLTCLRYDPIGMRDRNAGRNQGTRFLRLRFDGGDVSRFFLFHLGGILILAQSLEGGMTDTPVIGPFGESDFARKCRPDPVNCRHSPAPMPFVSARVITGSDTSHLPRRSTSSRALFMVKPVPTFPA